MFGFTTQTAFVRVVTSRALLNVNPNNKYSTDKYHFSVAKTLSWLLFILTFKYDTPHAVKGDKSYDCESCHFASHDLDRFYNRCKHGSRKCKSNDLSLVAMSRQISVTHSLRSRHILVRSTSRETYFLWFFFQQSLRSRRLFFLGRKEKYLAACKKKLRRLVRRLCLYNMTNMARGLKNVCEFISDIASLGLEKSLAVAV